MLTVLWSAFVVLGLALAAWAQFSLPSDTAMYPQPMPDTKVTRLGIVTFSPTCRGPYRWMRHPMYIGNILLLTGLGGLAAGTWNALAFMTLAEMMMREWAWRERVSPRIWP